MGDKSGIEWTDATWNPIVGCSKVSPGCDNCYAISMSRRIEATGHEAYQGITTHDDWTGLVKCLPERLEQPLRWRRPRRIFVNSMSDLFHPDVPDEFIQKVFAVMALASHHQFQILTKRPKRMASLLNSRWSTRGIGSFESLTEHYVGDWDSDFVVKWPLPNVWLGTSIESDRYTFRARHLAGTPAMIRFLSLEPLLGPLPTLALDGVDWVIAGGESGPSARPMHPEWVREIRDLCQGSATAFFFKQWGAWSPNARNHKVSSKRMAYQSIRFQPDGTEYVFTEPDMYSLPGMESMIRVGKKSAGRELDGLTWDEYPPSDLDVFR